MKTVQTHARVHLFWGRVERTHMSLSFNISRVNSSSVIDHIRTRTHMPSRWNFWRVGNSCWPDGITPKSKTTHILYTHIDTLSIPKLYENPFIFLFLFALLWPANRLSEESLKACRPCTLKRPNHTLQKKKRESNIKKGIVGGNGKYKTSPLSLLSFCSSIYSFTIPLSGLPRMSVVSLFLLQVQSPSYILD